MKGTRKDISKPRPVYEYTLILDNQELHRIHEGLGVLHSESSDFPEANWRLFSQIDDLLECE